MASRRFNKPPPTPKGQSRETCCNSLSLPPTATGFVSFMLFSALFYIQNYSWFFVAMP